MIGTVPRVQYRSLTILNDSLSVGTQYLELMEVMIKYWTGRGIKKQSVPRIFHVSDIIADKDNRFMKAIKRNHLHREQEKMEVLTSKVYLSSINFLVLNFFLWIQLLWKCLVFQTWIFFSKYEAQTVSLSSCQFNTLSSPPLVQDIVFLLTNYRVG